LNDLFDVLSFGDEVALFRFLELVTCVAGPGTAVLQEIAVLLVQVNQVAEHCEVIAVLYPVLADT